MSETDKNGLISQFAGVTGVDTERARFYLESAAWNLDLAMGSFYDQGDDVDPAPDMPEVTTPAENDPPATAASNPHSKPQSRFGTIANIKEDEGSNSDSDREAYYAGGSEHGGGQQILDPRKKKKKNADKFVEDMFKAAKDHGAEEVGSDAPSGSKPSNQSRFGGTAYRLGDTDEASLSIPGFSAPRQSKQFDKVLKLWKEGFSIDNGPVRGYNEPENQEFLASIKKGEVPQELTREAKGGEVNLNMEDHRNEDYKQPKVIIQPFSGSGNRLGSPSASIAVNPAASASPAASPAASQSQASAAGTQDVHPVDESMPCTNLQIRLSDGSRLVAKFNHSHTISDVRNYINSSRPQFAISNYVLMTTFPKKELTDETQTLKDASLLNAVLVQRNK